MGVRVADILYPDTFSLYLVLSQVRFQSCFGTRVPVWFQSSPCLVLWSCCGRAR